MRKYSNKNYKNTHGCFFKIGWFICLCLISTLLSRYILVGINDMLAIGKPADLVLVEIPEGASLSTIANILCEKGLISEKGFFKLYVKIMKPKNKFSSGSFEMQKNMDYQSILNHLQSNKNIKNVVEVTFTEGMNTLEYGELLEKNDICSKDEFLKACNSSAIKEKYDFLKDIQNPSDRVYLLEGYLFPDTYQFYQGEKTSQILDKLLTNYKKKIISPSKPEGYSEKTSIKDLAEKKGWSVDYLITVASLIQAEAANKEDMYKVSSVISNRLATLENNGINKFGENNMNKLQLDATSYYPYRTKEAMKEKSVKSRNKNAEKYDTYKIIGLPPGPICNPGTDAVLAALNPAQTDYFYYFHSDSGQAHYAKTNPEHLQNVRNSD
ncbi:MAG: endolytic transglycosylase MltG [Acutalibacteraceae bacterium]